LENRLCLVLSERSQVQLFEFSSLDPKIKVRAYVSSGSLTHLGATVGVRPKAAQVVSQRLDISFRGQKSSFPMNDSLPDSIRAKANHRQSHGLGFGENVWIPLGVSGPRANAGRGEDPRPAHPMSNHFCRLKAQKPVAR
jgi:hypothetical protein